MNRISPLKVFYKRVAENFAKLKIRHCMLQASSFVKQTDENKNREIQTQVFYCKLSKLFENTFLKNTFGPSKFLIE